MASSKKSTTVSMRFLFSCLLLFNFSQLSAQEIDSLGMKEKIDTIETIVSDSSIIYVIQSTPVTIIEKVAILKKRPNHYFSILGTVLYFIESRKARSGFEKYTQKVNEATRNKFSYGIGINVWRSPKKIYSGLSINYFRLRQTFEHISLENNEPENHFNYFNYADLGFHIGYWFNKKNRFSYIIHGGIHVSSLLSYSGYVVDKNYYSFTVPIKKTIKYREFIPHFSLNAKILYTLQNGFIEMEPYIYISPFSLTVSKEAYSVQRLLVGIRIGITHNLF